MTTEFSGEEQLLTIHGRGVGEVTDMVVKLAQEDGYSVAATGPGQFRVVRQKRPTWAVVAAILTFPFLGIGLLFLLVKKTDSGTVAVFEGRDGTKVRLVGAIDPSITQQLTAGEKVGAPVAAERRERPEVQATRSTAAAPLPDKPHPTASPQASVSQPAAATRLASSPSRGVQVSRQADAPSLIDSSPLAKSAARPEPLDPSVEMTVARPMTAVPAEAGIFLKFPDGRSVPLGRGIILGRSPQAPDGWAALLSLAYPDGSLSKTHAALEPSGSGLTVTDLHSTNGTMITNGGQTSLCDPGKPVDVQEGTQILAGDVTIEIRGSR